MENDPIIEAAKRDLADLETRRSEIEAFLARYETYKGSVSSAAAAVVADSPKIEGAAPDSPRSAPADKVMSAVHDIIGKRRDALTLTAIYDALVERGITIGGKNPKQNLSQKLSAHALLKSYGKRGWYFADAIPPCLQTNVRLSDDEPDYEEGPDTEVTRPLRSNGAADLYSA